MTHAIHIAWSGGIRLRRAECTCGWLGRRTTYAVAAADAEQHRIENTPPAEMRDHVTVTGRTGHSIARCTCGWASDYMPEPYALTEGYRHESQCHRPPVAAEPVDPRRERAADACEITDKSTFNSHGGFSAKRVAS